MVFPAPVLFGSLPIAGFLSRSPIMAPGFPQRSYIQGFLPLPAVRGSFGLALEKAGAIVTDSPAKIGSEMLKVSIRSCEESFGH